MKNSIVLLKDVVLGYSVLKNRLFLLALFLNPSYSTATIFWSENFEGTAAQVEGRWASSCGSNWSSQSALSLSKDSSRTPGSTSLKEYVDGLTTRTPEYLSGTCFMDRHYPDTAKIFLRYWERTDSNFQYDPFDNRSFHLGSHSSSVPSWWIGHFYAGERLWLRGFIASKSTNNTIEYMTSIFDHNNTPLNTPKNSWVCVQIQINNNTKGASDGVLRQWSSVYDSSGKLNRTLNAEYLNQSFQTPFVGAGLNLTGDEKFQRLRIWAHHGVGSRWYDDIAVGDEPIDCEEVSVSTKPRAPTNLRMQ